MKYKKFYRKTSLKQKGHGDYFLSLIEKNKPKHFLEIGVFHGVTARNVCELMYKIHGNSFTYIGIDLFEENNENKHEVIPKTSFKNPVKHFYFKYIKRQDPYSMEAVMDLLKKFKENVYLIKGNSKKVLKKIDMTKIDYVFLDGGHDYETVKNDLVSCIEVVNSKGTILCDDYNLSYAPGVKRAIDEFVEANQLKCEIVLDGRFAKIEKNYL